MKLKQIVVSVVLLSIILIGWSQYTEQETVSTDPSIISTAGMHWHPKIAITISGEEIPIPANIGLAGGHNPMHTHETDGTIHLEYEGVVREDDIRLGRFFELWGKEFNNNQIFENTNSDTERVHMFVNGVENSEFENYLLQENDLIEIKYGNDEVGSLMGT